MSSTINTDIYTVGNQQELLNLFESRSLAIDGAFMLPHLAGAKRILDAGCGVGAITLDIAKHVPEAQVVGIDIDKAQIDICQQKHQASANVTFKQQDICALDFPDEHFDVIFAHTVFMHLSDPNVAIQALLRVCRSGGKIMIREPAGSVGVLNNITDKQGNISLSQLFKDTIKLTGGCGNMGIELKTLAIDNQLEVAHYDIKNHLFQSMSELYRLKEWYQLMLTGNFGHTARELGLVTQSQLLELSLALDTIPFKSGAIAAVLWGELVAIKP